MGHKKQIALYTHRNSLVILWVLGKITHTAGIPYYPTARPLLNIQTTSLKSYWPS